MSTVENVESRPGLPVVLVVDNDARNLFAMEAVLRPLACRIEVARSGSEAIARTRAADFAAILMDVRMPGLDGYAAGSFIRQNPRSARTPILFISGADDTDVVRLTEQYGNAGEVDSLQKPFDVVELRSKITDWLRDFKGDNHDLEPTSDSPSDQPLAREDVPAVVAHDLRGPLTAISMSADCVRRLTQGAPDSELVDAVRRHLDLVRRSVNSMNAIASNLLDNARIESGKLQLDVAPHPLDEVIVQALELLRPIAQHKQVSLEFTRKEEDCTIDCDRDRILQVLSNMLGNAVKFTPPMGKVHVETTCTDLELVTCVSDTGPGIGPDEAPYVFEKYWQGRRQGRRNGVGLGLPIAKQIVLAHRGRIWLESQPGQGSRFFFSLPRKPC